MGQFFSFPFVFVLRTIQTLLFSPSAGGPDGGSDGEKKKVRDECSDTWGSDDDKKTTVILRSSDGREFKIEEAVAMKSEIIRRVIMERPKGCPRAGILIPDITGAVLSKVIDYCKRHAVEEEDCWLKIKELTAWDAEFIKVDNDTLLELIKASHYLKIQGLLELLCRALADLMYGKSAEEIRKMLKITITPEKVAEMIRGYPCPFEPKEESSS